jgi:hypothetical protein
MEINDKHTFANQVRMVKYSIESGGKAGLLIIEVENPEDYNPFQPVPPERRLVMKQYIQYLHVGAAMAFLSAREPTIFTLEVTQAFHAYAHRCMMLSILASARTIYMSRLRSGLPSRSGFWSRILSCKRLRRSKDEECFVTLLPIDLIRYLGFFLSDLG